MDKINSQSDFTLFEENIFPDGVLVPFNFTYTSGGVQLIAEFNGTYGRGWIIGHIEDNEW